jgi:ABC-type maltose transport system permease subunit
MLNNLAVGTAVIGFNVLVHTLGLILTTKAVAFGISRLRIHGRRSRILAMIIVVVALFGVISVEIWIWAGMYLWLGVLDDFETALYFSTVTFSTIGYGDIVPSQDWRILAALEGINGFLLIGWSTAYLVAAGTRVGPFRTGEHF